MATTSYNLICHFGAVAIRCEEPLKNLRECNCSPCARSGFLHWYVPSHSVSFVSGKDALKNYTWHSAERGHYFCQECGTAVMRTGYDNGIVSLNARCLTGVDVFTFNVQRFDGRKEMPSGPYDPIPR
jgi:hypothetical protein